LNLANQPQALSTTAKVFNLKHQSTRVTFEYEISMQLRKDSLFEAKRVWQGNTLPCEKSPYIAMETALWSPEAGLLQATMHQPHLDESASLDINHDSSTSVLNSKKTNYQQNIKQLTFTRRPCTLLSILFEITHHWTPLLAGEVVSFDYAVLKVQAHTGVSLRMQKQGSYRVVSVTPNNWFWRMLFGSTNYYFQGDVPALVKIEGLLEPRDRNLRGKYVEYLGRSIFDNPVDLSIFKEYGNE